MHLWCMCLTFCVGSYKKFPNDCTFDPQGSVGEILSRKDDSKTETTVCAQLGMLTILHAPLLSVTISPRTVEKLKIIHKNTTRQSKIEKYR